MNNLKHVILAAVLLVTFTLSACAPLYHGHHNRGHVGKPGVAVKVR